MMKFVKHKATAKKEISKLTESGVQVERLIAFFFLFLILCHNLACLWFLVAKIDDFGERTWVYRYVKLSTTTTPWTCLTSRVC